MAHDTRAPSDVGTDEISDAIDELLATMPEDPVEQRGRQYDLGLAWVHHPRGRGGLGGAARAPARRRPPGAGGRVAPA